MRWRRGEAGPHVEASAILLAETILRLRIVLEKVMDDG
jgi:hypothetical protein